MGSQLYMFSFSFNSLLLLLTLLGDCIIGWSEALSILYCYYGCCKIKARPLGVVLIFQFFIVITPIRFDASRAYAWAFNSLLLLLAHRQNNHHHSMATTFNSLLLLQGKHHTMWSQHVTVSSFNSLLLLRANNA